MRVLFGYYVPLCRLRDGRLVVANDIVLVLGIDGTYNWNYIWHRMPDAMTV
jgi:hypothetical protein